MNRFKKIAIATTGVLFICFVALFCFSPRFETLISRLSLLKSVAAPTEFLRGNIYDCHSNTLATNKTLYNVYMDCCVVTDDAIWEEKSGKLANELAVVHPIKDSAQWKMYFAKARESIDRYIPIVKNVGKTFVDSLQKLTLFNDGNFKGGFICESKFVREYPYGNLARRTIGVKSNGEGVGIFGVEGLFEDLLKGGNKPGSDIYTTLDMEMQTLADSILRKEIESDTLFEGGCIAVMEVKTGNIKAVANIHRNSEGIVGEYFNYFTDYMYEPGAAVQNSAISFVDSCCISNIASGNSSIKFYDKISSTSANLDATEKGYEFFTTPIHILAFYNAIANNGIMMQPKLVTEITNGKDTIQQFHSTKLRSCSFSKGKAVTVKNELPVDELEIVGKKGSSRVVIYEDTTGVAKYRDSKGRQKYANTFVGFYPNTNPEYSIICTLFTRSTDKINPKSSVPYNVVKEFVGAAD